MRSSISARCAFIPSISGWANSRDARFGWKEIPEIFYFFRAIAVLHVAPEMILQRCLARLSPPAHCYGRVRKSDITLAISIAAWAASVPRLIFSSRQRSRASNSLAKYGRVDHRNAIIQRDPLKRIRNGTGQIVRVISIPL